MAGKTLARHPPDHQLVDQAGEFSLLKGALVACTHHVFDHGANGRTICRGIGMKAGKDRGIGVEGKGGALGRSSNAIGEDLRSWQIKFGVRLQRLKGRRRRLERIDRRALGFLLDKEAKEANVRADVDNGVTLLQGDAMLQITTIHKNLFVDILGLVGIEMRNRQPVGQAMLRLAAKQAVAFGWINRKGLSHRR